MRTSPKQVNRALREPESRAGIRDKFWKKNVFMMARNIILKTHLASGGYLTPHIVQIKIDGVHVNNSSARKTNKFGSYFAISLRTTE